MSEPNNPSPTLTSTEAAVVMPGLIQSFPPEILSEIFAVAQMSPQDSSVGAVLLSQVCHQWRQAAIGDSALWLEIVVGVADLHHVPVITELLLRSKERQISIGINIEDHPERKGDIKKLRRLLVLISSHVWRACQLFVYAPWQTWQIITKAFANEEFPNLSMLNVELVPSRVVRPGPRLIQPSPHGILGPILHLPPPHQPTITFPFPRTHRVLEKVRTKDISLPDCLLPNLEVARISGNATPNLLGRDGRLNRWFLDGPKSLYFEEWQVPPMGAYRAQPIKDRETSTTTHLVLSRLSATPRLVPGNDGLFEWSCIPFFDSLYTPGIRCLHIDRWNLKGRSWNDFLWWLLHRDIRFPDVVDLRITGMHFWTMDYALVAFFLGSFPRMRFLRFRNCLPGTWEVALEVLQLDATLCPHVRGILLNDSLALLRDDPLPFARELVGRGT
ncbi:hypothetical protein B0H12DRAFT_1239188 [Mycena haematopus]|nr:hypothetical protein B0H12DRAFT_1239188 [Mycena haematopus]